MHETGYTSREGLREYGVSSFAGANIDGSLIYESPVFVHQPSRLKDCTLGAFAYLNTRGTLSAYRCHIGRYAQVGEQVLLGPPEHPQDWFSNHPFAFTQPAHMPHFYAMPEFARLAPDDATQSRKYIASVPLETVVGHEAYIGAGSYVRRGVTIGAGAVIGAGSVVLHDIPPYAIAAGSPARIKGMRFDEAIVERLLALQWWHYDLAPFKHDVDFSNVEATLDFFEQRKADGTLEPLMPATYKATREGEQFRVEALDHGLYSVDAHPDYPALDIPVSSAVWPAAGQ